ncbi:MAG: hypothetical protein KJ602_02985 [Actinobacteria bacterium]|nr:hypothetical protein [Actinomycetota bacterium]MCG2819934.1 hypothetical protein [Actinomycetes bacterium]
MPFDPGLDPGRVLTNQGICAIFRCSPMGAMRGSRKTNTLVLSYTPGEAGYWTRWVDGVLHYQGMGRRGDQGLTSNNKTLGQSASDGVDVFLFKQTGENSYIFEGRVGLTGSPYRETMPDSGGTKRRVWIFPLKLIGDSGPGALEEEPVGERRVSGKRKALTVGVALLSLAVAAVLVFLLASLGRSTPEKTVGRFFDAIEKGDAAMLADTLSPDPKHAGAIAVGLAPGDRVDVRVLLTGDITTGEENTLKEGISGVPGVEQVTYYPAAIELRSDLSSRTVPAELVVLLDNPLGFTALREKLKDSPKVREDPGTVDKDIRLGMERAINSFLSRVVPGVRFSDMEYVTVTRGDEGVVSVRDGVITRVGEHGETVAIEADELDELAMVPIGFGLARENGQWHITSFPGID